MAKKKATASEAMKGCIAGGVVSVVGTAIVAVIMLFGFQDGLAITERCNVSWSKMIVVTAGTLVLYALQMVVGYLIFRSKDQMVKAGSHTGRPYVQWSNRGGRLKFWLILSCAITIGGALILYLGVMFLTDQNGNFLWMFQHGLSIVAVAVTIVIPIVTSYIQKEIWSQ